MADKKTWDSSKIHKGPHNDFQPIWSVTTVNHLGGTKCQGHFFTHGQALNLLYILDPAGRLDSIRIYTHFMGNCYYCGGMPDA